METSMIRMKAYLTSLDRIVVNLSKQYYSGISPKFYLRDLTTGNTEEIFIDIKDEDDKYINYYFVNVKVDLAHLYQVLDAYGLSETLQYTRLVKHEDFDKWFFYDKHDLGHSYHKEYTEFKLWAPTALEVKVEIINASSNRRMAINMVRQNNGVFYQRVNGDYECCAYNFLVRHHDSFIVCLDPYAYSSNANGKENFIVNLERYDDVSLNRNKLKKMTRKTDAIIYEASVRDFTMSDSIKVKNKGKFLGMIESKCRSEKGHKIGFDYLKDMGFTHVQLLPIQDFATVDEEHPELLYNWGYDMMQYGVVEGSYVLNPNDPYARINDLRLMVAKMHYNNIRVVMDVVYNHVFDINANSLERSVPGYFFRRDQNGNLSNGSWCGNDLNTTAKMCRKYIIAMCLRFQKLFGIDGYRFDLMGIIDTHTMKEIYNRCSEIDDDFLVYGEGWNMGTALDDKDKSIQDNHAELLNIGFFNDLYRDTLKGGSSDDALETQGYFTGNFLNCDLAGQCIMNTNRYSYVDQSINYLECHDNATLADKISKSNQSETYEIRKKRQLLLNIMLVLSQGIPFFHAGQEFYISKHGMGNTYNAPDSINAINWNLVDDNYEDLQVIKKMIALRKNNPGFRYETIEGVKNNVSVSNVNQVVTKYVVRQNEGEYQEIVVYMNPSFDEYKLEDVDRYEVIYKNCDDYHYISSLSVVILGLKR